jgi:hypothetical protein
MKSTHCDACQIAEANIVSVGESWFRTKPHTAIPRTNSVQPRGLFVDNQHGAPRRGGNRSVAKERTENRKNTSRVREDSVFVRKWLSFGPI